MATTDTPDQFVATCDGARIDIEHRDCDDVVLIDTLLVGPLTEAELAALLQTYVDGAWPDGRTTPGACDWPGDHHHQRLSLTSATRLGVTAHRSPPLPSIRSLGVATRVCVE